MIGIGFRFVDLFFYFTVLDLVVLTFFLTHLRSKDVQDVRLGLFRNFDDFEIKVIINIA